MRGLNQTLSRFTAFLLSLILFFSPTSPVGVYPEPSRGALRVQEPRNSSTQQLLQSGLEESLEHPFFSAMQKRQARVRELAVRAQGLGIDIGFTPEEVDSLSKPRELLQRKIQWRLDNGQIKEVSVVRVKDTVTRGKRPAKGGIRYILSPRVLKGDPFEKIWNRFLKGNPTPEQARQFLEGLALQVAKALARGMSWKIALVQLDEFLGGAKGDCFGLDVDDRLQIVPFKDSFSPGELARLDRAIGRMLAQEQAVGPQIDVPAPDVDTNSGTMTRMEEEYLKVQVETPQSSLHRDHPELANELAGLLERSQGQEVPLLKQTVDYERTGKAVRELAVFTGKPVELGGSLVRADATGLGGLIVAEEIVKRKEPERKDSPRPLEGMTVAVHGFGKAGEPSARLFTQAGARVLAVSDSTGYLYRAEGFTLPQLQQLERLKRAGKPFNERRGLGLPSVSFFPGHRRLLELKVDILVPAAIELVITQENAARVQARYVIPEANGAVTPEANALLAQREVTVVPDSLASAGGVIVSWLEMLQNFEGVQWRAEDVEKRLRERLVNAVDLLWRTWQELKEVEPGIDLATAGDLLSVRRLVERFVREEKQPPFIPWNGSSDVLVRQGPYLPLNGYPIELVQYLQDQVLLSPSLREVYGKEIPLVPLPEISWRKPVYLWREPTVLPTGSTKPRMLAVLFDLFLNGDPYNLSGLHGKPLPLTLGTQSTGNHGQAMAWFAHFLDQLNQGKPPASQVAVPKVTVYSGKDIPPLKKNRMQNLGAVVRDEFEDYSKARAAVERDAQQQDRFLYWRHGVFPINMGNATSAVALHQRLEADPRLKGKRIAVVTAAGAGGRIAGLAAGLRQLRGDSVKVIAAQTDRIDPVFEAALAGHPVRISLPPKRVAEDGIAVDAMEEEAMRVFLAAGDAVVRVPYGEALSATRWLHEELANNGNGNSVTEVVTGVSLAALLKYPNLFKDSDAVIIDETGINVDPEDLWQVRAAPLPEELVGLEESELDPAVREIFSDFFVQRIDEPLLWLANRLSRLETKERRVQFLNALIWFRDEESFAEPLADAFLKKPHRPGAKTVREILLRAVREDPSLHGAFALGSLLAFRLNSDLLRVPKGFDRRILVGMRVTSQDPASRQVRPLGDTNFPPAGRSQFPTSPALMKFAAERGDLNTERKQEPDVIAITPFERDKNSHLGRAALYQDLSPLWDGELASLEELEMDLANLSFSMQVEEEYRREEAWAMPKGLSQERAEAIRHNRQEMEVAVVHEIYPRLREQLEKRHDLAWKKKDWGLLHQTLGLWIELEYSFAEYLTVSPGVWNVSEHERAGRLLQEELIGLRQRQKELLMGRPAQAAGPSVSLGAGLEENSPQGSGIDWVGDIYHLNKDKETKEISDQWRTIFFSFRPNRSAKVFTKSPAAWDSLQNAALSNGDGSDSHILPEAIEIFRKEIEPFLKARVILLDGSGQGREVSVKELQLTNLYRDSTLRVSGLLGNEAGKLERRGYPFDVEISVDGGKNWRRSSERGYFQFEPGLAVRPPVIHRFTVEAGLEETAKAIQGILRGLARAESPEGMVLIGPGTLMGDGMPALWPLLMELKAVLPSEEWAKLQKRIIAYTEDERLSTLLKEAGYEAPRWPSQVNELLAARTPSSLTLYATPAEWLLRGEFPQVTQTIELTPQNYLLELARLLELLGYAHPKPEQLQNFPESLIEYQSA
ncbi:MAG: pyridoxal-phosphate dependent enzyme [Candidatus Omnitrophica bacterium]|nr:pyridoxal-phosphate dependent enzyme [Candidatus Omnitrophota bacterium]